MRPGCCNGGKTVFQTLLGKGDYVRHRISPHDLAATVIYRLDDLTNEEKHYTASVALMKPIFGTNANEVQQLRDTPAFPPDERLRRIKAFVGHFEGAAFLDQAVRIGPPVKQASKVLPLPSLLFGPGGQPTRLASPPIHLAADPAARLEWSRSKPRLLREHGPFRAAHLQNPCLVYPSSMDRDGLIDRFVEATRRSLRLLGGDNVDFEREPYEDTASPRDIVATLNAIESAGRAGFFLIALPANASAAHQVYAGAKTTLKRPSKCFSSLKARRMDGANKLDPYVQRNTLGILIENGGAPWGLEQPLTYELQFGFDVARMERSAFMGAVVLSDRAASNPYFANFDIPLGDRIPAKVIGKLVLEHLERFRAAEHRSPRTILFQRKGRFLEVERRGVLKALERYAAMHPDDPPPHWVMVAIEKTTSVPLRLFRDQTGGQVGRSLTGSYEILNPRVGYLVTAGAPSLTIGTPKPLRIELVDWTLGQDAPALTPILQDLFWLSQLNWSAPEVDTRLPMTLRFTSEKLARFALEYDEGEDADEWDDEPGDSQAASEGGAEVA